MKYTQFLLDRCFCSLCIFVRISSALVWCYVVGKGGCGLPALHGGVQETPQVFMGWLGSAVNQMTWPSLEQATSSRCPGFHSYQPVFQPKNVAPARRENVAAFQVAWRKAFVLDDPLLPWSNWSLAAIFSDLTSSSNSTSNPSTCTKAWHQLMEVANKHGAGSAGWSHRYENPWMVYHGFSK